MRAIRRFTIHPALPAPLAPLRTLMLNLRWSWHAPTRALLAEIDQAAWDASGHDPVAMLALVSPQRLAALAGDEDFLRRLVAAVDELNDYLTAPRWYQTSGQLAAGPAAIAYFSPEFGITAALPQYSGGLGILAGDHLKSASDLGVPLIGVGLFYRHGYFTQSLSPEGWQTERYPASDPAGMPIGLLRDETGAAAKVTVRLQGGAELGAQIWVADVGRVPLLLLDTYIEDNDPLLREVTDRLYGGGSDHRLRQELLLGIGGVRAVRLYCQITGHPEPEIFHTNEGHAGFLGFERIREYLDAGAGFAEAVELTRAGTVFTTHTPVPAGIDRFEAELIEAEFGPDGEAGLPVDKVVAFGAETYPGGDPEVFNMAVMGMRLAQRVNGVSKLHGQVSREMFSGLWPGFDTSEVPIGSITNGVHAPSWVAGEILNIAQDGHRAADTEWLADDQAAWDLVAADPVRIFEIRRALRARLVRQARNRLRASWRQRGASDAELAWIGSALDENILTIGFARRVPSYKRLTMMLHDPVRLTALLLDSERPVQIVIAGKAHPADDSGKALIQQMVRFADDPAVRHRIVFLPDYDMELARTLVKGCDVWLNNPLRPLEACGTSGMKAALNGALNLSIRDGWWDEWFDGENGWAIPSADSVTDQARRDGVEAAALYDLLALSVAPMFYDTGSDGLPRRWLEMVAHTLRVLGPKTQATRMVRQYTTDLYLPAAQASRTLAGGGEGDHGRFAGAVALAAWKQRVKDAWPAVKIELVETDDGEQSPGAKLAVRAGVALGELSPDDVAVEVVYGRAGTDDEITDPVYAELELEAPPGPDSVAWYCGEAVLGQPGPFGYTVRVLPRHPLLAAPAELGLVRLPVSPAGLLTGDLR
ncbi:MAG TPA: alpha-glucan family phosphorylase [Streptosporangiaceae bacterium]|nr:alpha-glucan family phosphorylase [Streptosporangiaceae bacterium]